MFNVFIGAHARFIDDVIISTRVLPPHSELILPEPFPLRGEQPIDGSLTRACGETAHAE